MVAHRPEWVISRQRVWGVPIVAFYCASCEGLLLDEALVAHVAGIMRDGAGADEWYTREAAALLPAGTRCPKCGGGEFRKETDILDVWFDSGCSHAAVLETRPELRWPAEMYLEGSDQHRGWFHSSLLEAVGTRDKPPYRSVLTHGFVVDGEGRKMSKSGGNNISPDELIPKYGAEVLRLWVAAEDSSEDIRLSHEILNRLADAYRRIRNTSRFLLGTLADFDPERDRRPYGDMDELDHWALLRLGGLIARVRRAYEEYQFHVAFHAIHNFCAVDLSSLYLDIIKDRLYVSAPDDSRRRASQTVCFEVLTALTRLMAPILTFTADEVWSHIPGRGKPESVHLVTFPEERGEWLNERLSADWERLLEVRGEVSRALEAARQQGKIGKGIDAVLYVPSAPEEQWLPLLEAKGEALLTTLFNVSGTRLKQRAPGRGGAVREPGHPRPRPRGRARADPRLEEVRALLDLEPARGRGPRAPDPLRALRPGRDGAPAVRSAGLTAVVVLVLDLLTKHLALERLAARPPGPRDRRLLLPHPRDESRSRLRDARGHARGLALARGPAVDRRARGAGRRGPAHAADGRAAHPARPGAHLRRRRRQPDRPRALRRGGGLPRLLLARIPLAGVQRGGRVHLRRRRAAGAPHAHGAARSLSLISVRGAVARAAAGSH